MSDVSLMVHNVSHFGRTKVNKNVIEADGRVYYSRDVVIKFEGLVMRITMFADNPTGLGETEYD